MSVSNDANVCQMLVTPPSTPGFTPLVAVGAYKVDDCAIQLGGVTAVKTGVTLPTGLDQLEVGSSQYSVAPIGVIHRMVIYNRRLNADELATVGRQTP